MQGRKYPPTLAAVLSKTPHSTCCGQKKKMASTREGGTEGVAEGPGLKDFCHPPPGARGLPRWRWR